MFADFFRKFHVFSANFAICLLNFDEILSEFRENAQKIAKFVEISRKLTKSYNLFWKFPEFFGIDEIIHLFNSLIQSTPL